MTTEPSIVVYVDESGSDILSNNDPNDRYYVSVGIIVPAGDVSSINAQLDEISARFNRGAELKSSKIGNDKRRRLALLRELGELKFQYIAIGVDNQKLDKSSGYRFRNSYYKNLNKHLYQCVANATEGRVKFVIDEHGTTEFQNSALQYFNRQCDMFHGVDFVYTNDKSERLVQLADIISGTIRKLLIEGFAGKENKQLREALRPKEIALALFPTNYSDISTSKLPPTSDDGVDSRIESVMLNKASRFIEEKIDSEDENERMQVQVLQRLIESHQFESGPIHACEFVEQLNRFATKSIGKEVLLSSIIGGIRRQGIIIAGTKKGYKLATSEADIRDYVKHDQMIIMPMLGKLSAARKVVRASVGRDILADPMYADLREQVSAYSEHQLEHKLLEHEIDDESVLPGEN